jgi:tRNA 2-thiouridine synthesizing protein A
MYRSPPVAFDRELDARGLECPLPILRTKKSLRDMASGEVLKILATDPGSVRDFHAFSRQSGNELLGAGEDAGEFHFFLRKR